MANNSYTYRSKNQELEGVLETLSPIASELREALEAVQRLGYGAVTLRFERGTIKQVTFEGSFIAKKM